MNISDSFSRHKNDLMIVIVLIIPMIFNNLFPEYSQLTNIIMIGGLLTFTYLYSDYAQKEGSKYQHLKVKLYGPDSFQEFECFIQGYEYSQQISNTENPAPVYATKPILKFPVPIKDLGKISKFVIQHDAEWTNRVDFRPGKQNAKFKGELIDHPNSDTVICYETGIINMELSEPVPTWLLKHAGKDYWVDRSLHQMSDKCQNCETLEREKNDLVRQNREYAQKNIELIQVVEHLKDIIRGLQRYGTKVIHSVWMLFNEMRSRQMGIANALKSMGGWKMVIPIGLALVAICVVTTGAVFLARPDIFTGIGESLSNPIVAIPIILGIIAIILFVSYLIRRRSV